MPLMNGSPSHATAAPFGTEMAEAFEYTGPYRLSSVEVCRGLSSCRAVELDTLTPRHMESQGGFCQVAVEVCRASCLPAPCLHTRTTTRPRPTQKPQAGPPEPTAPQQTRPCSTMRSSEGPRFLFILMLLGGARSLSTMHRNGTLAQQQILKVLTKQCPHYGSRYLQLLSTLSTRRVDKRVDAISPLMPPKQSSALVSLPPSDPTRHPRKYKHKTDGPIRVAVSVSPANQGGQYRHQHTYGSHTLIANS